MRAAVLVGIGAGAVCAAACGSQVVVVQGAGAGGTTTSTVSTTSGKQPVPITTDGGMTSSTGVEPVTVVGPITGTGMTSTGSGMLASCNPVTNAPCDFSKGQACDANYTTDGDLDGFKCYDPPNDQKLCGKCDDTKGPFCVGSETCALSAQFAGTCMRFCCGDGDCGSGTCLATRMNGPMFKGYPGLGVCVDKTGKAPACDAPQKAPSNGACVKI